MRILLTNDDGVLAPGIRAAAAALKEIGDVTVCAPDREQSGTGTAVSLQSPLRLTEVEPIVPGVPSWRVEGTPCDAAIVALEVLMRDKVDLLVAGINAGANLGEDVLVSGTVGAALQGYFRGVPSLAFSVTALADIHWEPAAQLLKQLATALSNEGLSTVLPRDVADRPLLLNVNLPNLPAHEIKGVEITRLGKRAYADVVKEGHDGRRQWYWVMRDKPVWELVEGTDIWAIRHNQVSITPLHTDLTYDKFPPSLVPIAKVLFEGLQKAKQAEKSS
ncbi:MAG: 5'/3'-nucleotidase SurE [Dehalococcoidia bacterium]|nr:5'/3'-nucleotidase SurE [Dehalococcoidia bacterium]